MADALVIADLPEAWLRGPIIGVPAPLMPAAHALVAALEDIEAATVALPSGQLWARPGGVASIGFHLRHVAGSTGRLLAYARCEALTPGQLAAGAAEAEPGDPPASLDVLMRELRAAVAFAIETYRATDPADLEQPRAVGRAALPSTLHGLLFHAAEHARRHAGQVVATAGILRGLESDRRH